MSDQRIIGFFNHFSRTVLDGLETSKEQIVEGIPNSISSLPNFPALRHLTPDQAEATVPLEEAATITRETLLCWADDEEMALVVEAALETYKEDDLAIGMAISMGLLATLMMITASTEFRYKRGNFEIKKSKIDANTIDSITKLIGSCFGKG